MDKAKAVDAIEEVEAALARLAVACQRAKDALGDMGLVGGMASIVTIRKVAVTFAAMTADYREWVEVTV